MLGQISFHLYSICIVGAKGAHSADSGAQDGDSVVVDLREQLSPIDKGNFLEHICMRVFFYCSCIADSLLSQELHYCAALQDLLH